MFSYRKPWLRAAIVAACVMSGPLHAVRPADPKLQVRLAGPSRAFMDASIEVKPSLVPRDGADASRVAAFENAVGGTWEVRWDVRGDRPNVVQGSGVPLIPGSGNRLAPSAFGIAAGEPLDLASVQRAARGFIDGQSALLKLDGIHLRDDPERSFGYGEDKTYWSIEFAQYVDDVPVDGAFVYVRISHGNVVQFGAERIGDVNIDVHPSSTRERAFQQAWSELGFPAGTRVEGMSRAGDLRIFPSAPAGEPSGTAFTGKRGSGYAHVLAWVYQFRVEGNPASWRLLVDARTNRVIDLRDARLNADAAVTGGVFPNTYLEDEVVLPMPFASVQVNGVESITSTLGIYDYSGGTASTGFDGKYFRITDSCGAISLSNSTDGNLAFGTSGGTDCATAPDNAAGAGNTHASRTAFYHLSRINEKARHFLPDNAWLQSKVTANMNRSGLFEVCNAGWDPESGTMAFGRSLNTPEQKCSNTGELAAVFLHEWGHGLDQNTGGVADDQASGEAVGDTFAFLETKQACMGPGFHSDGTLCEGCTTCTGVRDPNDFSLSGTRTIASPANILATDGINCAQYVGDNGEACPYTVQRSSYAGPMGYEGHCESYIASSANWDLKNMLVDQFGQDGWNRMDKLWFASLTPSKNAYQVESGGQCNANATVNGCAATNWYTVYLGIDDDDGNLANGTPNACRIWDAFDAHGIACGKRPACSGDVPDFRLRVATGPQSVCAPASATYTVDVTSQLGFDQPVTLSATGQPSGTTVSFSPNPATPGGSATMSVGDTDAATAGTYVITVQGAATGSSGHSADAQLTLNSGPPDAPSLSLPADGATAIDTRAPVFDWAPVPGASSYTVEVASDPGFTTIAAGATDLARTQWTLSGANLDPNTRYYWRVRARSTCGEGANSTAFSFTTNDLVCRTPNLAIPGSSAAAVEDSVTVTDPTTLSGLRVLLNMNMIIFAGELEFRLGNGQTEVVLRSPASPQCQFMSGMDVVFDDAAAPFACPAELAGNVSGPVRPVGSLDAAFGGRSFAGTWTLSTEGIADAGVDGTIYQWCLEAKGTTTDRIFADGFDGRP